MFSCINRACHTEVPPKISGGLPDLSFCIGGKVQTSAAAGSMGKNKSSICIAKIRDKYEICQYVSCVEWGYWTIYFSLRLKALLVEGIIKIRLRWNIVMSLPNSCLTKWSDTVYGTFLWEGLKGFLKITFSIIKQRRGPCIWEICPRSMFFLEKNSCGFGWPPSPINSVP